MSDISGAPIAEGILGLFKLASGKEFKAQVSAPSNETAATPN
jgi:hypothetical protein